MVTMFMEQLFEADDCYQFLSLCPNFNHTKYFWSWSILTYCLKIISSKVDVNTNIYGNWPLLKISLCHYRPIGLMVRVFTNGPGDRSSIPGRVIPKTQKMILDVALLNTQHYKGRIKDKVKQSREWSSALPYTSV